MEWPRHCTPEVEEFCWQQMRKAAAECDKLGEWVSIKTAKGAILHGRWKYWYSKTCHPKSDVLRQAKSQYRLARDMEENKDYYLRKPPELSAWLWYQQRLRGQ